MATEEQYPWLLSDYTKNIKLPGGSEHKSAWFLNDVARLMEEGNWPIGKSLSLIFGYWSGGEGPGPASATSSISRTDFSNDTVNAINRSQHTFGRRQHTGVSSNNFGWFAGGLDTSPSTQTNLIDRIDYSNDSVSASSRCVLGSDIRWDMCGVTNSLFGWFCGGSIGGPVFTNRVERLDYSNDTTNTSERGPIFQATTSSAAVSTSNFGWIGGGQLTNPSTLYTTRITRIDYSNDTVDALNRTSLTIARAHFAGVNNGSFGWFGGGQIAIPAAVTNVVDRITFSSDNLSALDRCDLLSPERDMACTTNGIYGYFGRNQITRLDFANDTVNTVLRSLNTDNDRQFLSSNSSISF